MCDTIFSNSYSYILICLCSSLIVHIWFFLNGNLFLCYRFMLFLEFNSQIDYYSLLDKNFLLTTLATRNCLSCKKNILFIFYHFMLFRVEPKIEHQYLYDKQQQITVTVQAIVFIQYWCINKLQERHIIVQIWLFWHCLLSLVLWL